MCWAKAGLHFQGEAERGWAPKAAQAAAEAGLLPALPGLRTKLLQGILIPRTRGFRGKGQQGECGISRGVHAHVCGRCCRNFPGLWKPPGLSQHSLQQVHASLLWNPWAGKVPPFPSTAMFTSRPCPQVPHPHTCPRAFHPQHERGAEAGLGLPPLQIRILR